MTIGLSGFPELKNSCFIDYIEAHLSADISREEVTQLLQLSRFHLARRFKASFDHSPHQYITRRRIEVAKRLLRGSEL